MSLEKDLKKFIVTRLMRGKDSQVLTDDVSLFETGIIDSLGLLEMVSFLEERFKVRVEDEELIPENFETVSKLINFVESKIGIQAK
ncbi:MAG: hypothetical protein A2144_01415 [Chloroflexi bacterium RBG_16_50_9]|nr:MAG: hypothetical protein A2144_01415 [Chloroflexi bacterium RBG_16_50_9]